MQLGMVGLGKMGANMTRRLLQGGHQVVVTDLNADAIAEAEKAGATGAPGLENLVGRLSAPRAVWVMVPAGAPTENTIMKLGDLLDKDDVVIDGGNSFYKNTIRLGTQLGEKGVHLADVGTSGGVWGLQQGYSMMVGGPEAVVARLNPILETLAPASDKGWGRVGPTGAGHFVKMVHNGIEYGMMQAFAEGFAIMKHKQEFGLDLADIARIWQHGSVIRSWLLDLTKAALDEDQELEDIAAYVPDSGEGRWTVSEAIDLNVAAPVITLALLRRIHSREEESYTDKMLSIMRNAFGGHAIKYEE